jgi:hypothetical protein
MSETVVCCRCGAALAVPAGVQFVSCNQCRSQLAVRRDASVTFTSALDAPTPVDWHELTRIEIEQEIARIDREWQLRREDLMVSGRYGHRYRPSVAGGVFTLCLTLGFGSVWTLIAAAMASEMGSAWFGVAIGVVFIGVGALVGLSTIAKGRRWNIEEANYRQRRAAAEARLDHH